MDDDQPCPICGGDHLWCRPDASRWRPRRPRSRFVPVATLVALAFSPLLTAAQTPPPAESVAKVPVGPYDYPLPQDEPVMVCVDARTNTLDGDTLAVRVFLQGSDPAAWYALPTLATKASGRLAAAQKGDCFPIDSTPANR